MKKEVRIENWSNGQKKHEAPYVNGQKHGLAKKWHFSGHMMYEIPFANRQRHGLEKWWDRVDSLGVLIKWHQGQVVWKIRFYFDTHIPGDEEIELFFHF